MHLYVVAHAKPIVWPKLTTAILALSLATVGCSAARVSSHQIQQLRTEPTSCTSVPGADSSVYDTTQVSEQPVPRSVPTFAYPAEARRRGAQGRVVVEAVVSSGGAVEASSVTITQSAHALLDAEARRAISLATFWPACRDGAAVRTRIAVPFDFKLSGNTAGVVFAAIAGVWAGVMAAVME